MFGLSGTGPFGRSGTRSSAYREPESALSNQECCLFRQLNYANRESFGFLLTAHSPGTGGSIAPPGSVALHPDDDPCLTHVTLLRQRSECRDWLRFGKPVANRQLDPVTRVASFVPGQIFAAVRCASHTRGTTRSSVHIVRAVGPGEGYSTLLHVDPGAEVMLSLRGWPRVRQLLGLLDAIEHLGIDACQVAPHYWRHVHNRLVTGLPPRPYSRRRHDIWRRYRTMS